MATRVRSLVAFSYIAGYLVIFDPQGFLVLKAMQHKIQVFFAVKTYYL